MRNRLMRWGRVLRVAALSGLLLGVALMLAATSGARAEETVRAHVGFGMRVRDDELEALLNRYDLVPVAVYMQAAGLTGAHRTYVGRSAGEVTVKARAKSLESFGNGLQSNLVRLQRFVREHTEAEVLNDAALQEKGRGLLSTRAQLEAARAAVARGEATIIAVEVAGSEKALEFLESDRAVQLLVRQDAAPDRERVARVTQAASPQPYVDEQIRALAPEELYRRIHALAGR